MPGAKRKYDEDTWIVTQSKKFKCGQLIANVYATTLAQLRLGARNFFQSTAESHSLNSNSTGSTGNTISIESNTGESSPFNSPPASPSVRDIISDRDMSAILLVKPNDICQNCSTKTDGWEKCYYCEKLVCHINVCEGCQDGFCSSCCITKYDNPSGESYSCYGCLR